jgi:hypothetical protein
VRWERLFADLAAGLDDESDRDRDALAEELTAEAWGATSWRELIGRHAVLEVEGAGRLEGAVELVGREVIHLTAVAGDILVRADAVMAVRDPGPRITVGSGLELGWRPALRAIAAQPVQLHCRTGVALDGVIDAVGHDFLRLRSVSGARTLIPIAAVAAVRSRP